MQLTVFAVGRMKNGPERDLAGRYFDRLGKAGPAVGLTWGGVTEIAESRNGSEVQRKAEEAAQCLALVQDGSARLIALDEGGKSLSSQDFSAHVATMRDDGVRRAIFAIGGPDGHAPELLAQADLRISLGRMTFPHQIVRVLIAEQLYRAVTILAGHPYHRA